MPERLKTEPVHLSPNEVARQFFITALTKLPYFPELFIYQDIVQQAEIPDQGPAQEQAGLFFDLYIQRGGTPTELKNILRRLHVDPMFVDILDDDYRLPAHAVEPPPSGDTGFSTHDQAYIDALCRLAGIRAMANEIMFPLSDSLIEKSELPPPFTTPFKQQVEAYIRLYRERGGDFQRLRAAMAKHHLDALVAMLPSEVE